MVFKQILEDYVNWGLECKLCPAGLMTPLCQFYTRQLQFHSFSKWAHSDSAKHLGHQTYFHYCTARLLSKSRYKGIQLGFLFLESSESHLNFLLVCRFWNYSLKMTSFAIKITFLAINTLLFRLGCAQLDNVAPPYGPSQFSNIGMINA